MHGEVCRISKKDRLMPDKDIEQKVSGSTRVIREEAEQRAGSTLGLVAWEDRPQDSKQRQECKKRLH